MSKIKFANFSTPYVTDHELAVLLGGSQNSRHSKIKRMLAQQKLLHIRRGLYCLTEEIGCTTKPHPFALAQFIYGPSYISLESALSYHQLIPERVMTTTSVTNKRAKEFDTPLGLFVYMHLPPTHLLTGVELIQNKQQPFFVATPWKAICDYIFCYKKNYKNLYDLVNDLRIDTNHLPKLTPTLAQTLDEYYQSMRIHRFLKAIQREAVNEY